MSDTSKQGCWLCSQTEIFLKQTFKAWWGPLDAYVSVNPIQTVLRINMEKDCCSSSDVYVALQEPFSHRLLESSAPKNRPHAGPWEARSESQYSIIIPQSYQITVRKSWGLSKIFFFFFLPHESCLVSMAWTSRNCEVVPWLLGQRSCKMVSASGSAWLALTYLSGWIKLNCLNLDLCQS